MHPLASSNRIAWADTSSGCFSIKSAYRMIKERLWNLRVEAWNLPWKEERLRCGIGSDARCSICGHELEDVIHAIRDCGTAKDVRQLSRVNSVEAERWIQLRIDETVKINTGCPAAGGAVRENNGKWIIGYNRRLGACSIIETELWDILDGVLLVQERHYHKILEQTDNIKVIEAINDSLSKCSNSAIIRRIAQLLQKVESWSLDYIPGEENIEADCIAKFAFGRGKGLHLFETSFESF
ncbi:hypothetical protein Gotri_019690 [Gossypium trilobum]|uniref:RNase H type-1 domain-containing protein n=1 Tax=Gossypium trilobum TaxID=34281 RepID=A0A7J9EDS5_9ROSI|nr:hypothetical protein [Gossypium trilobum]